MIQTSARSDFARLLLAFAGLALASGLVAGAVAAAIAWTFAANLGAALSSEMETIAARLDRITELAQAAGAGSPSESAAGAPDSGKPARGGPDFVLDAIERRLAGVQGQLDQLLMTKDSDPGGLSGSGPPGQRIPMSMAPHPSGIMPGIGLSPFPTGFAGIGSAATNAPVSAAGRRHLENALQQEAVRARELIEIESIDPAHPDPAELMRAIQYCREETLSELRAKLLPEEIGVVFPMEIEGFGAYSQ
jgi:hypothetical protein